MNGKKTSRLTGFTACPQVGLITVVLAVLSSGTTWAQDDPGIPLLDNFLQQVTTLSARFDQSLIDAQGATLEDSSGTLSLQRPGRFRWVYREPYEQVLVADGLNVWSYDVDLAQVTVKPQAEVLGSTPALLLGGADGIFDDFAYIGSETDRDTVWVELRPYNTENGFTKVELGFNDGDLRRMVFSDNLQQSTLIVLYEVTLNKELSADLFEFALPEDVDLVGEPLLPVSIAE